MKRLLRILAVAVVATGMTACAEAQSSESKELSSSALVGARDEAAEDEGNAESAERPEIKCIYACTPEGHLKARITARCGTSTEWGTVALCKSCGSDAQTASGVCPEDER